MHNPLTSDLAQLELFLEMKAHCAPDAPIVLATTFADDKITAGVGLSGTGAGEVPFSCLP